MTSQNGDLAILKTVSLTSALERELERLIVNGELAPGERLNEIQLATRFGTSRGPLREAMRSLEAKGFVTVIRNRGVFVRQLTEDEAREIYEVRGTLFGLAARLVCERMTEKLLANLTAQVDAMQVAADANDFDAYYPLNLKFHATIMEAAQNETMHAEYRRLVSKLHLFRAKSLVQGGGLSVSNTEHVEILAALGRGDGDAAHLAGWHHVDRAKRRMLAALDAAEDDQADKD
ncbi:GntR family transcriptional regulator (plasmid) [Pacificitalea manganoxidans]|uniref:GntR family transcriptional regulator n=1 Tax=Pacificitalea manganoxidans TaxID=1411902 RepID=A0A291M463_9RHOB|nr:FCD domain-containing protein [Pacificitalea manganoxidans]ATI43535.1 GntR family transcriptional regulator [Pacificitalea manganoxidans]MBF51869.1 GntR family transcriptional regulator [Actibacterium sp.]MDR6309869.1 DNA-binding GntR family transcriptional regulator [Pacificitalea manganoxidans]OWU67914.1 GntR family transcriptional regulator [Roseovarius sp. 22II1-1F6A]|tara:strand:- start:53 stop:751 length:699 start_codon:yes stop_codon:yes gene_type:complete